MLLFKKANPKNKQTNLSMEVLLIAMLCDFKP